MKTGYKIFFQNNKNSLQSNIVHMTTIWCTVYIRLNDDRYYRINGNELSHYQIVYVFYFMGAPICNYVWRDCRKLLF